MPQMSLYTNRVPNLQSAKDLSNQYLVVKPKEDLNNPKQNLTGKNSRVSNSPQILVRNQNPLLERTNLSKNRIPHMLSRQKLISKGLFENAKVIKDHRIQTYLSPKKQKFLFGSPLHSQVESRSIKSNSIISKNKSEKVLQYLKDKDEEKISVYTKNGKNTPLGKPSSQQSFSQDSFLSLKSQQILQIQKQNLLLNSLQKQQLQSLRKKINKSRSFISPVCCLKNSGNQCQKMTLQKTESILHCEPQIQPNNLNEEDLKFLKDLQSSGKGASEKIRGQIPYEYRTTLSKVIYQHENWDAMKSIDLLE